MDWHENAKIRHELYAVVQGVPQTSQGNRLFQAMRASSPTAGSSRGKSPTSPNRSIRRSMSPSPSASPSPEISGPRGDTPTISLIQCSDLLPQTPSYEDVTAESAEQDWLEGTFTVKRNIKIIYNPNPTGGVNSLDERIRGNWDDLGDYEVHYRAPIVCPPNTSLTLSGRYVAYFILV